MKELSRTGFSFFQKDKIFAVFVQLEEKSPVTETVARGALAASSCTCLPWKCDDHELNKFSFSFKFMSAGVLGRL